MPAEVEHYLSQLHREHLKPRGFKKSCHTFSRQRIDYVESFEIQGSAWNGASDPWRFYLNVGVEFPDVAPATRVRIQDVVPGSPECFDLVLPSDESFATGLVALIDTASERIVSDLPAIHEALAQRRYWIGY